jgi:hypothetical protein
MSIRRQIFYTFALALSFVLTSCNSKDTSPMGSKAEPAPASTAPADASAPAIPDPCKLLTKDEAAAILGEPVKDPEPGGLFGNRICDWKSVKLHGGIASYSVHIALTPESRKTWDAGKKLYSAKDMQPVTGIGDAAMFMLDDLLVYAKGFSININVLKEIDKPDHMKAVQAGEKAVADKAIPRL